MEILYTFGEKNTRRYTSFVRSYHLIEAWARFQTDCRPQPRSNDKTFNPKLALQACADLKNLASNWPFGLAPTSKFKPQIGLSGLRRPQNFSLKLALMLVWGQLSLQRPHYVLVLARQSLRPLGETVDGQNIDPTSREIFEVDTSPQGKFDAKMLRSAQARKANLRLKFRDPRKPAGPI